VVEGVNVTESVFEGSVSLRMFELLLIEMRVDGKKAGDVVRLAIFTELIPVVHAASL